MPHSPAAHSHRPPAWRSYDQARVACAGPAAALPEIDTGEIPRTGVAAKGQALIGLDIARVSLFRGSGRRHHMTPHDHHRWRCSAPVRPSLPAWPSRRQRARRTRGRELDAEAAALAVMIEPASSAPRRRRTRHARLTGDPVTATTAGGLRTVDRGSPARSGDETGRCRSARRPNRFAIRALDEMADGHEARRGDGAQRAARHRRARSVRRAVPGPAGDPRRDARALDRTNQLRAGAVGASRNRATAPRVARSCPATATTRALARPFRPAPGDPASLVS